MRSRFSSNSVRVFAKRAVYTYSIYNGLSTWHFLPTGNIGARRVNQFSRCEAYSKPIAFEASLRCRAGRPVRDERYFKVLHAFLPLLQKLLCSGKY